MGEGALRCLPPFFGARDDGRVLGSGGVGGPVCTAGGQITVTGVAGALVRFAEFCVKRRIA
jgi:hypothetical protein